MNRSRNASASIARILAVAVLLIASTQALPAQEIIELPAEDRWLDAGFEELYRVGSLQGGEWDTFGRVGDVAFDGAGNLYVLDTQAARFSVVDLQGNLVRRFGRVGEGPGEFGGDAAPSINFAVLHDGRIAVYDPGRRHFVVFDSEGEFERQVPLGGTTFTIFPGLQADPGSESVVSTGEVVYLGWTPGPDEDSAEPSLRYVMRYTLSGREVSVDTVAAGWKPPGDLHFAPRLSAGVLPDDGVAFIDSSAYAIKVTGPGGGVSRILTRPFPVLPVTDKMKAAYIDRELEDLEEMANRGDATEQAMAEFIRAQIESTEFYHEIAVLRTLRTSREGTIWVRRGRGDEAGGSGPIDLLTPDGRYLGSFEPGATGLPSAFGPEGLVAFVETNDLDVQTVVVKRLPPEVR